MRRIVTSLILSFALISGTSVAFAEQHNDRGQRPRHEQRDRGHGHNHGFNNSKPRPGGNHNFKNDHKHKDKDRYHNGHKGHKDKDRHPNGNFGRPGGHKHYNPPHNHKKYRPAPMRYHHRPGPPPPRRHYAPGPPPPPPSNLGHMVGYLTRGCSDVAVWQIDYDTYIVKYRRGNRFYTQRLYPYLGEYGSCNQISVNWRPMDPWSLIPSINLNINI